MGAKLFSADRWTDRQRYLKKLIVDFRNYAKKLKNCNSVQNSSSWKANCCSDSQEIPPPLILWTLEVHYRIQKRPPLIILNQIYPIHTLVNYFFNNIFQYHPPTYTSIFQLVSFLQISPPKLSNISLLPCMCHMPRPGHRKSRTKSN